MAKLYLARDSEESEENNGEEFIYLFKNNKPSYLKDKYSGWWETQYKSDYITCLNSQQVEDMFGVDIDHMQCVEVEWKH